MGLKVEVLQGLDGVVGVAPVARGVVEALAGEEVLIGGVEGGAAGVVQAIGVDLNRGGGISVLLIDQLLLVCSFVFGDGNSSLNGQSIELVLAIA